MARSWLVAALAASLAWAAVGCGDPPEEETRRAESGPERVREAGEAPREPAPTTRPQGERPAATARERDADRAGQTPDDRPGASRRAGAPEPPARLGAPIEGWPTEWRPWKLAIRRDQAERLGAGICLALPSPAGSEPVSWRCRYESQVWCPAIGGHVPRAEPGAEGSYAGRDACETLSRALGLPHPDTAGQPAWSAGPIGSPLAAP